MKKYHWKGLSTTGQIQTGILFANNKEIAHQKLIFQKIAVLKIKRAYLISAPKKIDFYIKLHGMLTANVPMIDALNLLKIHGEIVDQLRGGRSLSESIGDHLASSIEKQIIKIGEESQKLCECLLIIIKRLKNKEDIKNKMKQSATYPIILLSVSFISIFIMLNWVIPQFSHIFSLYNAKLPKITQALIFMSDISKTYGIPLLGACLMAFYLTKCYYPKYYNQLAHSIKNHTPIIKSLWLSQSKSSWLLFLSLCIEANIELIAALKMSLTIIPSNIMKESIRDCIHDIENGQTLHRSIKLSGLFTDEEIYKIHIGENTNQLPKTLRLLHEDLEKSREKMLDQIKQWMEPVTLIFISIIMGFILIGMYVPIFQIGNVL